MLGVGAVAQWFYLPAIRDWSDRLTLAAVCDRDEARARQFGELYGAEAVYADYDRMLAEADLNAVVILTPHGGHAGQVVAALEANRHVMVEKPLANTLAEALQICELSESKGLHVSCAPPNMLHPGQRRVMQLIEGGAIGKICLVRITQSSMGPGSRPGAPTDFSWFYRSGAGGMSSMAGYGLIKATGMLGPVKSLAAMSCTSMPVRVMRDGPAKGRRVEVDVPDNNVIALDFGEDLLANMDTGYVMMQTEAPSMELFGTEGVLSLWGGDMIERIRLYQDYWETNVAGWLDVDIPGLDTILANHAYTLISLADTVLDGKPLVNGPRHMAHAVEIMEQTWIAAAERRTVDLTTTFPRYSWQELPSPEGAATA